MTQPKERTLFDDQDKPVLPDAEVPFGVALLALGSVRGLGQVGMQCLVGRYGDDLGAVFRLSCGQIDELLRACSVNGAAKIAAAIADHAAELVEQASVGLRELEARKVSLLPPSRIPERLRNLNGDSPKWLFVEGSVEVLAHRPMVAVVGTRKPSEEGCRAAAVIAQVLAPYPVVLVSGLADGIDAHAHAASLYHGIKNLAFLGHGINLVFPEETAELRADIVRRGGAVASEYLPNQTYQIRQFVERNRLQAALADVVIPVEAASASGTAHTVRFARKYNRTLIGVRWKGAAGLVDDMEKEGDKIIDITSQACRKELDSIIQRAVSEAKEPPYPFQVVERNVLREMRSRTYRQEDVARLVEAIQKAAQQEPPSNGET